MLARKAQKEKPELRGCPWGARCPPGGWLAHPGDGRGRGTMGAQVGSPLPKGQWGGGGGRPDQTLMHPPTQAPGPREQGEPPGGPQALCSTPLPSFVLATGFGKRAPSPLPEACISTQKPGSCKTGLALGDSALLILPLAATSPSLPCPLTCYGSATLGTGDTRPRGTGCLPITVLGLPEP